MQIDQSAGRVGRTTVAKTASRLQRGGGFALPAAPDAPADSQAAGASPVAAATLSGIEGTPDDRAAPQDQDAAAGRHGHALLDALAHLQLVSLQLAGLQPPNDHSGDATGQGCLASLVQKMPEAADPGLRDVLQAIAARAAIELARRA